MPADLLAWRLDEAVAWLRERGLQVRVCYEGPPRRPEPPPGRPCRVVRVRVDGGIVVLTASAEAIPLEDVLGDGGGPCADREATSGADG